MRVRVLAPTPYVSLMTFTLFALVVASVPLRAQTQSYKRNYSFPALKSTSLAAKSPAKLASKSNGKTESGLSSLAPEAQGPISAALGKDDPRYWAHATDAGIHAENPQQALAADFTKDGAEVRNQGAHWAMGMRSYGYGENLISVGVAAPNATANRVEYRREGVTEWYVNGPMGLEQGFTLAHPPAKADGKPLTLALGLSGDLMATLEQGGTALRLTRKNGQTALRYTGLTARDAAGQQLRSWLELRGDQLLLRVEDKDASYPLTIDPWVQQAEMTASDGAANDELGISVAVDGGTVVVGAYNKTVGSNAHQGAAYVFVQSGSTWTQQAELTASDGAAGDFFGNSVAVSGGTVVVGAWFRNTEQGAAYVFVQSGTTWSQQQELTASDGHHDDNFGASVAVNGGTVLVGAPLHGVGSNLAQGAAYVFVLSGSTWTQQAELTGSDGAASDYFGRSVSVSGGTAVVGADNKTVGSNSGQGAAYVFVQSGTMWNQQAEMTSSDGAANDSFGSSVAVSGSTVVVGAAYHQVGSNQNQGAAYVFSQSGTTWSQQAELTASDGAAGDEFGSSVAVNGGIAAVGAPLHMVGSTRYQGAAYVFGQSGTTWSQQAELTASDGAASNLFGYSVALSGGTAFVGAPYRTVGSNSDQGALYAFVQSGGTWSQQAEVTASDGAANDQFGYSVAVSGSTAVVGAHYHEVGSNSQQGAAYVFVQNGTTWSQQAELTSSDGASGDGFGTSVAVSGSTIVVGARYHTVGSNTSQGAAYVFVQSGTTWSQQAELTSSDGAPGDAFGVSVAVSGSTTVVGAYGHGAPGAAYVFVRSGTDWTQQQELTASDGVANDLFGRSVAVSGGTAVVGANLHQVGSNAKQGAAYVFVQSGTTWSQEAELTASDGAANDSFGVSVAVSGSTAVVGAYDHTVGSNVGQGAAYVFVQGGTTWNQQAELTSSDGAANDYFGYSVGVDGNMAVVGAIDHTVGSNQVQGAAYVFGPSGTTWGQLAELTASDGAISNEFGYSVAVSGSTAVVGAPQHAVGSNGYQGAAYMFTQSGSGGGNPAVTLSPTSLNFGNQAVGTTSAAQTVTITNTGTASLNINSFTYSISPFQPGNPASTCTATLAAGASCTVNATFTPSAAGTVMGTLYISDSASDSPQSVPLSGTGVGSTATSLSTSLNPSAFGQSVTLTATITPQGGGQTTGTITFQDGSTTLGTVAVSSNAAAFITSSLAVGPHSITAVYSGDSNYTGSTSNTLAQTVNQASTSSALSSSVNPSGFGQSVALTATIAPQFGGQATGTITFKDGSTTLGSVAVSGNAAALTTSTLTDGAHSITAVYSGDSNFTGSTSNTLAQTVHQAGAPLTLSSSFNPSTDGQSVSLTATITPQYGGQATGTVTFKDGSTTLGSITVSGNAATLTTNSLVIGTHSITAVYGGDSNFTGSTSNTVAQVVGAATSTTTLTSSLNPSSFAGVVTFTATVSSSAATRTGRVQFFNGTTLLSTVTVASNTAKLVTTALPPGSDQITAVYSGDANNSGSTSPSVTQVVKAPTVTILTSAQLATAYGQPLVLTAMVTSVLGVPQDGETVTFKQGATVLGTGMLSGGVAAISVSTLGVGLKPVTAVYGGDATLTTSTSETLNQVVSEAASTTTLVSSANPSNPGQSVTFTATVTASGTPTGTVTFTDGTTLLGTGTLSGGVASYSTTRLAAGSHNITATYNGSTSLLPSTAMLTQVVQ